jgi:hypothetical protein
MRRSAVRKYDFAHTPSLAALGAVPALCVLFFLLFTFFYQFPTFNRLFRDAALSQAVATAQLLAASLFGEEQVLARDGLDPQLLKRLEDIQRQGQIIRMRIYSPGAEVVYSSEPAEVGSVNGDPLFQEILIGHKAVAAEAGRGSSLLETSRGPADRIGAYVPVTRQGRLLGVFEIYYDAAPQNQRRRGLVAFSTAVLTLAAGILLAAAGVSVSGARRRLRELQAEVEEPTRES